MQFLCENLFPHKASIHEQHVAILHGLSGPFKTHNLREMAKGDEGIRYPIIKLAPYEAKWKVLQTPAEEDLRARSDFVFAASLDWFRDQTSRYTARFPLSHAYQIICAPV